MLFDLNIGVGGRPPRWMTMIPLHQSHNTMTISTFILAIALDESGNNPRAVGKAGELSEYQITRQVWRECTVLPFTKANARTHADVFTISCRKARVPTTEEREVVG